MLQTEEPPIRKMSSEEIYQGLWTDEDSAKCQLRELLIHMNTSDEGLEGEYEHPYKDEIDFCLEFLEIVDNDCK